MFTASDIDQLRESLPECDFAADALAVPALLSYLKFYNLDPRQLPAPSGAQVRCSAGSFDAAGFRIFCQSFTFSPGTCRGIVFVLHGYYDHGGLYGKLLRYLLLKGYAVVLFDLPGHGLSSGDRGAITSFTQYTDVLEALLTRAESAALPAPWHLVGQSTGAAVAMDYCLRHCAETAPRVDKVALLAPLVRPHQWWRGSLLHSLLKHAVEGIPRNFVDNSHDAEFLHFLRREDPLQSRQLSARWVSALKKRWAFSMLNCRVSRRRQSVRKPCSLCRARATRQWTGVTTCRQSRASFLSRTSTQFPKRVITSSMKASRIGKASMSFSTEYSSTRTTRGSG